MAERDGKLRGEFTIVLAPLDAATRAAQQDAAAEASMEAAAEQVAARLEAGEPISRISRAVAAEVGVAKSKVYAEALRQQSELREGKRSRARASDFERSGGALHSRQLAPRPPSRCSHASHVPPPQHIL